MAKSYEQEFSDIIESSRIASDPRAEAAALSDAIRLADNAGDIPGGYEARCLLINCATFSGQQEKAIVAFTWCLAQHDRDPDQFDTRDLLWKYKWILGNATSFPEVSREKILDLQEDFHERLLEGGYSLRSVHKLRWGNAEDMGDFERGDEFFQKWQESSRDTLADCRACDQNGLSRYLGWRGKLEESTKAAAKLLDGSMWCSVVPQNTYGHLVSTWLRSGKVEELKKNQTKWYNSMKNDQGLISPVTQQMLLAANLGQLTKAMSMFEKHAPWAAASANVEHRFRFFRTAAAVFSRIATETDSVRLTVPPEFDIANEDHEYISGELADWLRDMAHTLAKRFDARNGNDYYKSRIAEEESLVFLVC